MKASPWKWSMPVAGASRPAPRNPVTLRVFAAEQGLLLPQQSASQRASSLQMLFSEISRCSAALE